MEWLPVIEGRIRMFQSKWLLFVSMLVMSTILMGCSGQEAPTAMDQTAPSAAALTALEMADSADGTSDKVVSKCPSCKLKMNGKAEHSATFGGYELHFCTDYCKESFEKDPEKALASLEGS
jgi:YHS domain-containing protein